MGQEFEAAGDGRRFQRLAPFLTGSEKRYEGVATDLGMSEAAVKVSVHRLRHRYGQLLRTEVARTLNDVEEVDAEIKYMFSALGG